MTPVVGEGVGAEIVGLGEVQESSEDGMLLDGRYCRSVYATASSSLERPLW